MNREFARLIVCLLDKELNLPSMILETLEEKLVAGKFDEVEKYYWNRKRELDKDKGLIKVNEKYKLPLDKYCLHKDYKVANFNCPFLVAPFCNYECGCWKEK